MDKDYGPKGFEKAWQKQLKGFNETKLFFTHYDRKTVVKYIDGNKLLGVEMYRCQFEIDNWIGHFQHYLDTGVFDNEYHWVGYNSVEDGDGKYRQETVGEVTAIPMVLEKKLWSVHSPAMNNFMKQERLKDKGMGFRRVPRPMEVECKWCGDSFTKDKIAHHEETCDFVIPSDIQ